MVMETKPDSHTSARKKKKKNPQKQDRYLQLFFFLLFKSKLSLKIPRVYFTVVEKLKFHWLELANDISLVPVQGICCTGTMTVYPAEGSDKGFNQRKLNQIIFQLHFHIEKTAINGVFIKK